MSGTKVQTTTTSGSGTGKLYEYLQKQLGTMAEEPQQKTTYTAQEVGAALCELVSGVPGGATAWNDIAAKWVGEVTIADRFALYMCLGDFSFSIEESRALAAANKKSQIESLNKLGYGDKAASSAQVKRIDAHLALWIDFLSRRETAHTGLRAPTVWYVPQVQEGMKEFYAALDQNTKFKKGVRLSRRYWWRPTAQDIMLPFIASVRLYRAVAKHLLPYSTKPTAKQVEDVKNALSPINFDFTDPTFSSAAQFSRDERPKKELAAPEYKEWIEMMAAFMFAVQTAACPVLKENLLAAKITDKDDPGYKQYKRCFHLFRWNIKNFRYYLNGNQNSRGAKVAAILPAKPDLTLLAKV